MEKIKKQLEEKWELVKEKNLTLSKDLIKKLQIELIFLASNFEGLKITHKEAELVVLNSGLKIEFGNKSLLQAKGQKIALDFAEDFAKKDQVLDIYIIKDIHRMILGEVWKDVAGEYIKEEVLFKKSKFLPPHYSKVAEEMHFFDKWLVETQKELNAKDIWDILVFATQTFHQLVKIHPFRDANGRVARVVFNLICRKYNLPYVLIPKSGKEEKFLQALEKADFGEMEPIYQVMGRFLLNSFDILLKNSV